MTPTKSDARLREQPGVFDPYPPERGHLAMTTVTHPTQPDPEAEPATMPLPRRTPGRTYPGRPPIERTAPDLPPSTTALIALLSGATGVC
ncbi:hypothetical protein MXD62_22995 [Frankia sp. Mgl5]|uniref:hypothetical protein n=1 Tax=Frankia sp. Mgl5 TaxID=2933793 RepID=UPI00200E7207|nr:hypothetical protein [Frankia sp. Mgl5]MCK9929997.1 hypothetical protein [Frankia sp. Mgl5]